MLKVQLLDSARHDRSSFSCGEPSLDRYLKQQAGQHYRDGISTTHVLIDAEQSQKILGYYTLCAAQLHLSEMHEADRKNLPRYPIPAMRIARLAISLTEQRKGHGDLLLGYVVLQALELRQNLGIGVVIVDALNEQVARFYRAYGFTPAKASPLLLYMRFRRDQLR